MQRKELWEKTDRWSDESVDVWFKSELRSGGEIGFGWSHEEPITDMMRGFIESYRDLPKYPYQFQTKLRNELRAKSGIMRGREFLMKDMYSYSTTEETHKAFYDKATAAYLRVFERLGLGELTYLTFASGGAFTQFSHEFQTLCSAGEDTVYVNKEKKIAINKEVLSDEVLAQLGLTRDELEECVAAEVGNIFSFGGTKSEQLGLVYKNEEGVSVPVILGSYGIGITRLVGVLAEIFSDEKGLVWPEAAAPFSAHLISLASGSGEVSAEAERVYDLLTQAGVDVLYDDRDLRAGEKFADSELIGIPQRIVISEKTMSQGGVEVVERGSGASSFVADSELLERLAH